MISSAWAVLASGLPVATAASYRREDLERWMEELAPRIEAVAGRSFLELPKVVVLNREEIRTREVAALVRRLSRIGGIPEGRAADEATREISAVLDDGIAFYASGDGSLYLVKDAIEGLFSDLGAHNELLAPILQCVLVHEMTHALQDQWAPMPSHGVEPGAIRAMREGHAVWVSNQICDEGPAKSFLDAIAGLDVLASGSPDEVSTWMYGYASRYVDAAIQASGAEAAWWLLEHPPTRDTIVQEGRRGLLVGWDDPEVLKPRGVLGELKTETLELGPMSTQLLLPTLAEGRIGREEVTGADAGLIWFSEGSDAQVESIAFHVQDPPAAASWVAERAEEFRSPWDSIWTLLPSQAAVSAVRQRRSRAFRDVDAFAYGLVVTSDGGRYHEAWALRGPLLLGVAVWAPDLGVKPVEAQLRALLDHEWPLQAEGGAPSVLVALPDPPLPPRPSWQYQMKDLWRQPSWDPQVCIDLALPILDKGPPPDGAFADLVHGCAVQAGHAPLADQILAAAGATTLDPGIVLLHAALHLDAQRVAEAEGIIAALPPGPDLEVETLRRYLLLRIAMERKDLGQVFTRASDTSVDPLTRAYAAALLYRAGRHRQAHQVAALACPELSETSRVGCQELLRVTAP